MLAVLTLVALLSGIAMPAMQRWYNSLAQRAQLSEIAIQFQRLAARAALLSQTVALSKDTWQNKLVDDEPALALPEGWSVVSDQPVVFYHSGICAGGNVDLEGPERQRVQLQVAPVSCDVSLLRQPS